MDHWLRIFGLNPVEAQQAGVAIVALVVMLALIRLFQVFIVKQAENELARNKISASNADTQSKLAEILDRQTSAIDKVQEQLSANTRTAQETMPFLQRLVQEVVENSKQHAAGLEAHGKHMIAEVDKRITPLNSNIATIPNSVIETVSPMMERGLNNALQPISGKLDGLKITTEDVQDKVSKQINLGEVVYRLVEDSHALVLIADRFASTEGLIAEFRTAFVPRVIALEADVKSLSEAIQEIKSHSARPTLDTVVAALEKRDSKPIPPMPPLDTPIGDVAQPPSLVITHGEAKSEGEVTQ